jgi:DNA primase
MTLTEIKQINIRKYLHDSGIYPVKDYGNYGMYHCPYRSDHNASLKVDYSKNVWHDFGTNEGGSIIDLLMKIANCTFSEAVNRLEGKCAYMQTCSPTKIQPSSPALAIESIHEITHPKLTAYVKERMINLDLANRYCREVHYRNRDNVYFAVGFRNDSGGYELNSKPDFKGCIPPKEITTFRNGKETCLVFEGFWDFLSYLTIQKTETTKHDVAVLNSTANVQKAMDFLKSHQEIYTYLDNDDGGRKATELIKLACLPVNNRSERYAGFKDLNDFLRNKPIPKPEVKKKNQGIRR